MEPDAGRIADAFRQALYAPDQNDNEVLGVPKEEFIDLVSSRHLLWAPDGDEAFDDRSYVVQFDIGSRVRVVAFKADERYGHDRSTLRDVSLSADSFYDLL